MFESGLTAAAASGSRVYASVFNPAATARSVDSGNTWTRAAPPLRQQSASALLETRRGTLLSATAAGIYRSTDGGALWTATGIQGPHVRSLVAGRGHAYASVDDASLWTSVDSGLRWSRVDWSRVDNPRRFDSPTPLSPLFIVDDTHLRGATLREFLASDDAGIRWSSAGLSKGVNALVRLRDTWFAGTWEGVFRSDDLAHWTECSSGLPVGSVSALTTTPSGDLIAIDSSGFYRSQDECRSWFPLPFLPFRGTAGGRSLPILASDAALGIVVFGAGVAQLSLTEHKWTIRAESLDAITAFAKDRRERYWLGTRRGVYRLLIDGSEWRLTAAGLDGDIAAVAVDPDGYLLAAVTGRGMFRARLP
jgi:ligand-binding sensor domain-containing protein